MYRTTIILPVSRETYLDAIFARLEMLKCDKEKTNLLVVVDGDAKLFVKARNLTEMSKFAQRLCIEFKSKHKKRHYDVYGRRRRISDIHNLIKEHIQDCDYIFSLEDDTIFQLNALELLLKDYTIYPHAGFIQGVQIGRWGVPYIGSWKVDDIYEPKKIESMLPIIHSDKIIEECDAGGFYCFITKKENYIKHDFKPFDGNGLGPDVDFGISLRQIGLLNYIDWRVMTTHKTKNKDISMHNTEPVKVSFIKKENRWRQIHI